MVLTIGEVENIACDVFYGELDKMYNTFKAKLRAREELMKNG
tara:strand:- start:56 stop:181 length:126 start_codon:yes stop_codon:yes gene_type:complete